MFSFTRLAQGCCFLALAFAVYLLVSANPLPPQITIGPTAPPALTVTTGFRGTSSLPTINVPIPSFSNGGFGAVGGGGVLGVGGVGGSGNVSGSLSTQILTVNLGSFFPNNGRLVGLPPPTMAAMLNNLFIANNVFLFSPFTSDTTGAPWSLLFAGGLGVGAGGGGGVTGGVGGVTGGAVGVGGLGGGVTGFGGGVTGFGGAAGGFGQGGLGGGIAGGFSGGFAGKGFGGFNGRKAQ